MELAKAMLRMNRSIQGLWVLAILTAVFLGFRWALESVDASLHTLGARWDGGNIRLSSSSDGPFVVFGIGADIVKGPKAVTTLQTPVVIIDSNGARIEAKNLKWFDGQGRPTPPPIDRAIVPIYIRPERLPTEPNP